MTSKTLTIGHSPDPDDAFMFFALTHGKIDTGSFSFRDHLEGIQGLNERAERGEFEITAVSLHQYPYISEEYALMPVGASMGDGYGPLVVGRTAEYRPGAAVAIPGKRTSAALLFALWSSESIPAHDVPFDQILERVRDGEYDYGVLIHEGQITYQDYGVEKVADLGEWWLRETSLPTPLGINVIRRDVADPEIITEYLRRSIDWAFANKTEAVAYSERYARGLAFEKVEQFIGMYVNDFTLEMGDRGRAAVLELLKRGEEAGLIPPGSSRTIEG